MKSAIEECGFTNLELLEHVWRDLQKQPSKTDSDYLFGAYLFIVDEEVSEEFCFLYELSELL